MEEEIKKLAEQLKDASIAHAISEQKMNEDIKKISEQLGVNVGDESTVAKVVKEETDKVE